MPRDYFWMAPSGSTLVSGSLIGDVQSALVAAGFLTGTVDGVFGRHTRDALAAFQADRGLPTTGPHGAGAVSDTTWPALMQSDAPSIFERCLQVTASFEGTGFTRVVGNFDGAGITWGIIGFTLANGELGRVLAAINSQHPDIIAVAFGADAADILSVSSPQTPLADKLRFADSVSLGSNKSGVAEPWLTHFKDLGSRPEVQAIQVGLARDRYWSIATADADNLGMHEELDLLLMFDVAVQDGGMGSKNRAQSAKARFAAEQPATARARRRIVAEVVADTVSDTFKNDVLTRKLAVADGSGTVHGGAYALDGWGFLDGETPVAIA